MIFRYKDESYTQYRSSPRQGFGGNYRRISDPRSPQQMEREGQILQPMVPKSNTPEPPSHIVLNPSVNPPKTETMVKVATVTTVRRSLPPGENIHLEQGPKRVPQHTSPGKPERLGHLQSEQSPLSDRHGSQANPHYQEEDSVRNSQSIRSYLSTFEEHQSWRSRPSGRNNHRDPKHILQQSNENLPPVEHHVNGEVGQVIDNVSKVTIVPDRAEITPTKQPGQIPVIKIVVKQDIPPPLPPKVRDSIQLSRSTESVPDANKNTDSQTGSPEEENKENTVSTRPEIIHQRQKSQEEIACEEQAKLVASQLPDHDKHLTDVILPPPEHKSTTDYMSSLFEDKKSQLKRTPDKERIEAITAR